MWETVPEEVGVGEDISWVRDELSNAVRAEDRKLLYVARVDGKMAGTSVIWVSRRDPKLAEFALPGTAPEFRRRGIGQALFDAPVADFRATGGESIFLGASSYAFRTYMRAGYHKLVGTSALAYVASGESPEAYLVDFFRGLGPAVVGPGEGADRTSAVPLVHTPHDWQVMDANVGLLSLRYSQPKWVLRPVGQVRRPARQARVYFLRRTRRGPRQGRGALHGQRSRTASAPWTASRIPTTRTTGTS